MNKISRLNILLVGSGGFFDSVLRYLVGLVTQYSIRSDPFLYGTLAVNVLGCQMIGYLGSIAQYRNIGTPEIRLFLFIGVLGGFTTFSTFGYDTFNLGRNLDFPIAFLNIFLHIALGLGAVFTDYIISRYVFIESKLYRYPTFLYMYTK